LICTICCREKDEAAGLLPAIERYRSDRIGRIYELAKKEGTTFAILSGKFALLLPEEPIPYYDKLLVEADIPEVSRNIVPFLKKHNVGKIILFVPDPQSDPKVTPYIESMNRAAQDANISLRILCVPPYLDRLAPISNL